MSRLLVFMTLICSFLFPGRIIYASVYDNAYSFYTKYAEKSDKPVHLNKDDGYIYFCSWGLTSTSETKYKTVGYSIRINADGINDSIEVKLGGSIVKDVSTIEKGKYTYVLRRAKLCKLQSLFNGNTSITWNKIFRKKNIYDFNAIMTVSEKGKNLCGAIKEKNNLRTIYAENDSYLYRTLNGIKNARNWIAPEDLNNFFGKKVAIEPVSTLEVSKMNICGNDNNVYYCDDAYYVRYNSIINLFFNSSFNDPEAASIRYHPNFNLFCVTGWGNNLIFYEKQGINGTKCKAGMFTGSYSGEVPLKLIDADDSRSSVYEDNSLVFRSGASFHCTVPDSNTIYIKPEGRVYYYNRYPENDRDEDNLCDMCINDKGKIQVISDAYSPEISTNNNIFANNNKITNIPISICDNLSGIRSVILYKSDGNAVSSISFSRKTNQFSTSDYFSVRASFGESYYFVVTDNVGNRIVSDIIRFIIPQNYNITARASGGTNSFNATVLDISVSGGNSQICSFVIYSDPVQNAEDKRIIIENMDVHNNTFPKGQYRFDYNKNVMSKIRNYKDGAYIFNIISGGELSQAEPKYITIVKDTTKPVIRYECTNTLSDGWINCNANIKVDVTDALSGVDSLVVKCDGDPIEGFVEHECKGEPIKAVYIIKKEGEIQVLINAKDIAGNTNSEYVTLKIDKTPPWITMTDRYEGIEKDGKWFGRNDFNGHIVIHDEKSGIKTDNNQLMLYKNMGQGRFLEVIDKNMYTIKLLDQHTMQFDFSDLFKKDIVTSKNKYMLRVNDVADNESAAFLYLNFDFDPPEVSDEVLSENKWNPDKMKGFIKLSDRHSGLKKYTVYLEGNYVNEYSCDGSKSEEVYIDFSEKAGKNTFARIEVEDMAGNTTNYVLNPGGGKNHVLSNLRTRIR